MALELCLITEDGESCLCSDGGGTCVPTKAVEQESNAELYE